MKFPSNFWAKIVSFFSVESKIHDDSVINYSLSCRSDFPSSVELFNVKDRLVNRKLNGFFTKVAERYFGCYVVLCVKRKKERKKWWGVNDGRIFTFWMNTLFDNIILMTLCSCKSNLEWFYSMCWIISRPFGCVSCWTLIPGNPYRAPSRRVLRFSWKNSVLSS